MGRPPGAPVNTDGMLTETLVKCTIVRPVRCAQVPRRTPPARPFHPFRIAERAIACPLGPPGHAPSARRCQPMIRRRSGATASTPGWAPGAWAWCTSPTPGAVGPSPSRWCGRTTRRTPDSGCGSTDEVASARRIHGLFTAQVIDSGVDDPVPWLATAYVPGPSLAQAVQGHGPLPPRTVLLLVAGIAEALQAIPSSRPGTSSARRTASGDSRRSRWPACRSTITPTSVRSASAAPTGGRS